MNRSFDIACTFIVLLTLLTTLPAESQTGTGVVTGRVVDTRGGAMQGASIDVEPAGATAVTNNQGEFRILNVASGPQKISVRKS